MNYSKHTYYAHSMHIYNTEQERIERDTLVKLGFNLSNGITKTKTHEKDCRIKQN